MLWESFDMIRLSAGSKWEPEKITRCEDDFLRFPRDVNEGTEQEFGGLKNPAASSRPTLTLTSDGEVAVDFFLAVCQKQHPFPLRSGYADCSESILHGH